MSEITCPCCHSENVAVVCRVLVEYRVEGELCAEQEWVREEVCDDTSEPAFGECKDCGRRLGFGMIGKSLAYLAAPKDEPMPFTQDENAEVALCVALLESIPGLRPVAVGARLTFSVRIPKGAADNPWYEPPPVPLPSCRLDAYEHFRRSRPGLGLPGVIQ